MFNFSKLANVSQKQMIDIDSVAEIQSASYAQGYIDALRASAEMLWALADEIEEDFGDDCDGCCCCGDECEG
jgi:hypothetical protein